MPAPRPAPQARDLRATPLEQISRASLSPQDSIAPDFRYYELTVSEIAARSGIDNGFETDDQLRAAVHLARHVLQPIRDQHGRFTPNSVFRSPALERAVSGRAARSILPLPSRVRRSSGSSSAGTMASGSRRRSSSRNAAGSRVAPADGMA